MTEGTDTPLYEDRWITCTASRVLIRGYYFPVGPPKSIPYARIRAVRSFEMSPSTGQWRIWGSGTFTYWAHWDPQRPHKHTALLLDLGRRLFQPLITPDRPDEVRAIIESHLTAR